MHFYEAPTPNDEEKPSEPMPAETEAQVPKRKAAAKKAISGGFRLTVFQKRLYACSFCLRRFFCAAFCRSYTASCVPNMTRKLDALF